MRDIWYFYIVLCSYCGPGSSVGIYLFIYLLQLGCYPVALVILHVNKT